MGCYSGVWWYCSIGLDFYQLTEVTLTAVVPRHFVNREAMDASQSSITETGGYFPGQRLNARKSRKDPLDPHSKTKWAKAVSLTAHKILNIGKCPSFGFLGFRRQPSPHNVFMYFKNISVDEMHTMMQNIFITMGPYLRCSLSMWRMSMMKSHLLYTCVQPHTRKYRNCAVWEPCSEHNCIWTFVKL